MALLVRHTYECSLKMEIGRVHDLFMSFIRIVGELRVEFKFCDLFKYKVKVINFSVKLYFNNKINLCYVLLMQFEFIAYC